MMDDYEVTFILNGVTVALSLVKIIEFLGFFSRLSLSGMDVEGILRREVHRLRMTMPGLKKSFPRGEEGFLCCLVLKRD
jgi:hypothetical protein